LVFWSDVVVVFDESVSHAVGAETSAAQMRIVVRMGVIGEHCTLDHRDVI